MSFVGTTVSRGALVNHTKELLVERSTSAQVHASRQLTKQPLGHGVSGVYRNMGLLMASSAIETRREGGDMIMRILRTNY